MYAYLKEVHNIYGEVITLQKGHYSQVIKKKSPNRGECDFTSDKVNTVSGETGTTSGKPAYQNDCIRSENVNSNEN